MSECDKFSEYIYDYFDLNKNQKKQLDEYITNCEGCRKEFDEMKILYSELSSLKEVDFPENLHQETMAHIKRNKPFELFSSKKSKSTKSDFIKNIFIYKNVRKILVSCFSVALIVFFVNYIYQKNYKELY